MAATNTCVQIQEEFGAALGEQMEPLGVAMASLDFETAMECVLVLIEFIQSKRVKSND
jgi:hypothetical protein